MWESTTYPQVLCPSLDDPFPSAMSQPALGPLSWFLTSQFLLLPMYFSVAVAPAWWTDTCCRGRFYYPEVSSPHSASAYSNTDLAWSDSVNSLAMLAVTSMNQHFTQSQFLQPWTFLALSCLIQVDPRASQSFTAMATMPISSAVTDIARPESLVAHSTHRQPTGIPHFPYL